MDETATNKVALGQPIPPTQQGNATPNADQSPAEILECIPNDRMPIAPKLTFLKTFKLVETQFQDLVAGDMFMQFDQAGILQIFNNTFIIKALDKPFPTEPAGNWGMKAEFVPVKVVMPKTTVPQDELKKEVPNTDGESVPQPAVSPAGI